MRPARHDRIAFPAGFAFRARHKDRWMISSARRGLINSIVVCNRSLSLDHGELLQTVRASRIPFLVDPDTAVLVEVAPDHKRALWLGQMPAGALISAPPITPADLTHPADIAQFAQAVASTQGGAAALSAGYFRVQHAGDPWRTVNQKLLAETRRTSGGRPVCAWLEVTIGAVQMGLVATVAHDYQDADMLSLRVAGYSPATASIAEADAVLRAVDQLQALGPRVILDCAGCYGAAALAVGGYAFTAAADHDKSVPEVLVLKFAPSSRAVEYEVPLGWWSLPLGEAQRRYRDGQLDGCADNSCDVLGSIVTKTRRAKTLREHYLHAAGLAASVGLHLSGEDLSRRMLESPAVAGRAWGTALARVLDDRVVLPASASH
jgi:hypothetical protein